MILIHDRGLHVCIVLLFFMMLKWKGQPFFVAKIGNIREGLCICFILVCPLNLFWLSRLFLEKIPCHRYERCISCMNALWQHQTKLKGCICKEGLPQKRSLECKCISSIISCNMSMQLVHFTKRYSNFSETEEIMFLEVIIDTIICSM